MSTRWAVGKSACACFAAGLSRHVVLRPHVPQLSGDRVKVSVHALRLEFDAAHGIEGLSVALQIDQ